MRRIIIFFRLLAILLFFGNNDQYFSYICIFNFRISCFFFLLQTAKQLKHTQLAWIKRTFLRIFSCSNTILPLLTCRGCQRFFHHFYLIETAFLENNLRLLIWQQIFSLAFEYYFFFSLIKQIYCKYCYFQTNVHIQYM